MAQQPRTYNSYSQAHMPNGASSGPASNPTANTGTNFLPNNGRVVQANGVRILCVADVRGNLKSLNELAKQARADYIIHTGDFGFYDDSSLDRIADKTLKHVAQYSPLLSEQTKRAIHTSGPQQGNIRQRFPANEIALSELPMFIDKKYTLDVPVYTVWGACEDVRVLEKFRSGEYKIEKLHIIDEANSRLLEVGGVKLRLLGLGGAVVMHKLFDNGEGRTTIAGGQGTMWTTLLQMGELVDTANRVYDPTETRVFVTHASPAREGLLNQLSVTLKADFSISAGLHFRYGSSYNEFSVNPTLDHYRGKLAASKASFNDVWETVKGEVEPVVSQNEAQQTLLSNALDIVSKMPAVANGGNPFGGPVPGQGAGGGAVDESAFKNMWNFNLADAAFGYLVLEIDAGRIGTEMRAQGFNFAHRGVGGGKPGTTQSVQSPAQPAMISAAMPTTGQSRPPVGPSQPSINQQTNQQTNPQINQQTNQQTNQQARNQNASVQAKPAAQLASQAQQDKASNAPRVVPSPAAPAPSGQVKPATPQPQATGSTAPTPTAASAAKSSTPSQTTNGTASTDKQTQQPPTKPASPAVENKPSTGLFVHNMESEDAVRDIFVDEDKSKIVKIEKWGKGNHVVHFNTHEEAKAALDRQPADHKKPSQAVAGQPRKPNIKWFDSRGLRNNFGRDNRESQGAGTWQASNRGGTSSGPRPGYQSGASDSESGRGRGGFNRGDRGDRGGRGGRGRGRGRGGFNKSGGDEGSAAPASSTPSSTPAAPSTEKS